VQLVLFTATVCTSQMCQVLVH